MKFSSIEAYEVKAEAFRRMTGMMAPGKDESAAAGGVYTYEERRESFNAWLKQHGEAVTATMRAVQAVCQRAEDEDA